MSKSSVSVLDFELITIMLLFAIVLSLFSLNGLLDYRAAMLLFWLLSQGRLLTRFSDYRRSKGPAWRYLLFNQLVLFIAALALGVSLK